MPRLGVILIRAGAVTDESVNRALSVQSFAGGRLGTLLIERGSASEDDIGKALSEQHGCPYIPWKVLGGVPASVIAALPTKFAIRHSAVPVELGEGWIRIALRDPANLRILDELFFVTGKKILAATAPEVRLYQALEKYYGERRTPRFAILAEKMSRPMAPPAVIRKPLPPPPDFSTPADMPPMPFEAPVELPDEPLSATIARIPDEPPIGWGGLPPPPEEVDEEPESIAWEDVPPAAPWTPGDPDRRRAPRDEPPRRHTSPAHPPTERQAPQPGAHRPTLPSQRPSAPPPPPMPPAAPATPRPAAQRPAAPRGVLRPAPFPPPSAPDFSAVRRAQTRDTIFRAALDSLAEKFRRRAVFAVRPDGVTGWEGSGEGVDLEALQALDIPWSAPSIFLNVKMSRSFYLGPLPPLPRHKELVEALGGWPPECIVQPVVIRDRVVAYLYAETASEQGATPTDLTHVRELAGAVAAALAASIRLKKKQVI
ncbi:MAG TPA: hypothetical protein VH854_05190 [Thermoanaerobaculia bacterium]|nr:hypothetical protein [Thermoanaerobaculia bacterium]